MAGDTIRKQFVDLTQSDFVDFPVWEFALDEEGVEGQDETTVRPFRFEGLLDPSDSSFLVRANFQLADGTKLQGLLTPLPVPGSLDLGHIQPCILTRSGPVSFWYGLCPIGPEDLARSYARLEKSDSAQVFPIQFESVVPLKGGAVKGELSGFVGYEDWQTKRLRVSK